MFRWFQGMPIESYALEARWDALGDLVRPSDRRRHEAAEQKIGDGSQIQRRKGCEAEARTNPDHALAMLNQLQARMRSARK